MAIRRVDMLLYGGALAFVVSGAAYALLSSSATGGVPRVLDRSTRGPLTTEAQSPATKTKARNNANNDSRPSLPEVPVLPPGRRSLAEQRSNRQRSATTMGGEMRLLSEARRNLPDRPEAALDVVERHRRFYPNGTLREEREALAIEALVHAQRQQVAERRYLEFLADFPRSELRRRLAVVLRRRVADRRPRLR